MHYNSKVIREQLNCFKNKYKTSLKAVQDSRTEMTLNGGPYKQSKCH